MPFKKQESWNGLCSTSCGGSQVRIKSEDLHEVRAFDPEKDEYSQFFPTFKAFGAFIQFRVSMLAAIMSGTFATGHEGHTDPTPFPAHITVLFFFRFWHRTSPLL